MGTVDKQGVVTMQELLVSALAQTDALTKLLIEKGLITEAEFMQKLSGERARYQAMFRQKGIMPNEGGEGIVASECFGAEGDIGLNSPSVQFEARAARDRPPTLAAL